MITPITSLTEYQQKVLKSAKAVVIGDSQIERYESLVLQFPTVAFFSINPLTHQSLLNQLGIYGNPNAFFFKNGSRCYVTRYAGTVFGAYLDFLKSKIQIYLP